jgi:hypothetical protein
VSAVTGRRRVVMTLDSAEFDSGDLARLSHLAQQLDAEFEAVFVEDLDVLRAANLPFLREYRFASMQLEAITQQRLEQEFRAVARRAEQALAQQAALRQVRWRFRVWRGSLEQELLGALEADVLALPPPAMAIRNAAIPPRDAPIAVCFSGDEGDQRTLVTASALAAAKTPLTVVLVTDGRDVDELRQQAEAVAAGASPEIRFETLPEATPAAVAAMLRATGSGTLVLTQGSRLLQPGSLRELMKALGRPLLLIR